MSDSQRKGREVRPFEQWSREKVWIVFLNVARYLESLEPVDREYVRNKGSQFAQWGDWATAEPFAGGSGGGYGFRDLARRVVWALVLVEAILTAMWREDRRMCVAVRRYIRSAHKQRRPELVERGKVFVHDWLSKEPILTERG